MFTIETWHDSSADSCTLHRNLPCKCNRSLAAGFIPIIKYMAAEASLPFNPAQGQRLQVKMALLMFYGEMIKLFQLP